MAKADFYTVTESFVGRLNGAEVEYHKGDVVPASDPAVKKMPLHFEPLVLRGHDRVVEQATAAPGEKRSLKAEPEPEPEVESVPQGKAMTLAGMKGR
jgi:hypothetical protein